MYLLKMIETDVLVIGGGMAGCFAAIKAKEKGINVALVDKGYVSRSGHTPWAGAFMVYNPDWGHNIKAWMNQINTLGEYLNNRQWTRLILEDSYVRYKDLSAWGIEFTNAGARPPQTAGPPRVTEALHIVEHSHSGILRRVTLKTGVKIFDRIMVTDLIKKSGKIVGAIGFPTDSLDCYVFKAKAVAICAGSGGFKSAGWPFWELTSDGHVMAYRVGAEITGKEFVDTHSHRADFPAYLPPGREEAPLWKGPQKKVKAINSEGKEIMGDWLFSLALDFEAHAGRAPIYKKIGKKKIPLVGGCASGLSVLTSDGIWPINVNCASSVPGLFAAGDSLATMFVGSFYSVLGSALATASVTGARAGWGAANYAINSEMPNLEKEEIDNLQNKVFEPLKRTGGFSSSWVTQLLQNLMIPYFVMYIKHGQRLQATLNIVEFLREHLVPKLIAKDSHELRLAHETKNMVLNAEMKLKASLFRTESRGTHYREDYPKRDDPSWLAWVLLKKQNGKMNLMKKQVPKEWWPDLSKPYNERYFNQFPS